MYIDNSVYIEVFQTDNWWRGVFGGPKGSLLPFIMPYEYNPIGVK